VSRIRDGLREATCIFEAAAWKYSVKVECGRCRQVAYFHAHGLWWRFEQKGWNDDFREAGQKLYCSACWKRTRRKVRPWLIETSNRPPTITLKLPEEREWKRAISRYRS
jgi:hypothetical protein